MHLLELGIHTMPMQVRAIRTGEVVDLTQEVQRVVMDSDIEEGLVSVFCQHTTCGIVINEFEDGVIEDLTRHMSSLVPDGYFAHDDMSRRIQNLQGPDEPANGVAHVRQMLFGATSQAVPIVNGDLGLGRWQRILFIELDEPRPRSLIVTILGQVSPAT